MPKDWAEGESRSFSTGWGCPWSGDHRSGAERGLAGAKLRETHRKVGVYEGPFLRPCSWRALIIPAAVMLHLTFWYLWVKHSWLHCLLLRFSILSFVKWVY